MLGQESKVAPPIYRLCEVVADIAYLSGSRRYHSGDSREDIMHFIHWAQEFEQANANTDWDCGTHNYMDAIQEWTEEKLCEPAR